MAVIKKNLVFLAQSDWITTPGYAGTEEAADIPTIQGIEGIVANILNVVVPLVGVVLLIMLIVGGFQYITSGGEAEQTAKARKTLTATLLGLIVVLGAWLIIKLIEEFTGLNLHEFNIPV